MTISMIGVIAGAVVVERIYTNVSCCSFVAPGYNSLKVYEKVEWNTTIQYAVIRFITNKKLSPLNTMYIF